MKRFLLEQSNTECYPSHTGLALVGLYLNRFTTGMKSLREAIPQYLLPPSRQMTGCPRHLARFIVEGQSNIWIYRNEFGRFPEAVRRRIAPGGPESLPDL
ncbi:MAG: hypothetical protein ACRESZ_06870 [Methylococcales bacterium]